MPMFNFKQSCICLFVYLCICVFVFGSQVSGGGWVDSGCHKLSENIWFVWSKWSYNGDMEGCDACGRTDNGRRNVKIELEFWTQNSQKTQYGLKARMFNSDLNFRDPFGFSLSLSPSKHFSTVTCQRKLLQKMLMLRISFHSHTSVIVDSTGPLVVCLNFVEPAGKQFLTEKNRKLCKWKCTYICGTDAKLQVHLVRPAPSFKNETLKWAMRIKHKLYFNYWDW